MSEASKKPRARKSSIAIGDWFDVPLPSGGHAAGLIARLNVKAGGAFCYFFGPRRKNAWTPNQVRNLEPETAVLLARVSILGFSHGGWVKVTAEENFDPKRWKMPPFLVAAFLGRDFHPGRLKARYSDDLTKRTAQRATPADMSLPGDSDYGHGALRDELDEIL